MDQPLPAPHSALTYPARPVNGGPLHKAMPKTGEWFIQPKYNGWRTLIHAPSRTMFNRKGERLSIAHEFKPALDTLQRTNIEWADCEALERRHNLGRGALLILDILTLKPDDTDDPKAIHTLDLGTRLEYAWSIVEGGFATAHNQHFAPNPDSLYIPPTYGMAEAAELWEQMRVFNVQLKCTFYEGIVAKRADSIYPIQLRSADLEFPCWMKHRWPF